MEQLHLVKGWAVHVQKGVRYCPTEKGVLESMDELEAAQRFCTVSYVWKDVADLVCAASVKSLWFTLLKVESFHSSILLWYSLCETLQESWWPKMPFLEQEHLNIVPLFRSGRKPMGKGCSISLRITLPRQVLGISDFCEMPLLWLWQAWNWVSKSYLIAKLILVWSHSFWFLIKAQLLLL